MQDLGRPIKPALDRGKGNPFRLSYFREFQLITQAKFEDLAMARGQGPDVWLNARRHNSLRLG